MSFDAPADRFQPGDAIAFRDVFRGRIKAAIPLCVVEDSREQFVGWLPAGAKFFLPADRDGNLVKDVFDFNQLVELRWAMPDSPGQLVICPSARWYSVLVRFHGPEWRVPEWYVNLQKPLTRSRCGLDSTDLIIDAVGSAAGEWRWKDELEFVTAVGRGFLSEADVRRVRAEAEAAIADAKAGRAPFDETWLDWRPHPEWDLPVLPARWRDIATR